MTLFCRKTVRSCRLMKWRISEKRFWKATLCRKKSINMCINSTENLINFHTTFSLNFSIGIQPICHRTDHSPISVFQSILIKYVTTVFCLCRTEYYYYYYYKFNILKLWFPWTWTSLIRSLISLNLVSAIKNIYLLAFSPDRVAESWLII